MKNKQERKGNAKEDRKTEIKIILFMFRKVFLFFLMLDGLESVCLENKISEGKIVNLFITENHSQN